MPIFHRSTAALCLLGLAALTTEVSGQIAGSKSKRTLNIEMQTVFTIGGASDDNYSPTHLYRADISIDNAGRLFALDRDLNQVVEFDEGGKFVRRIGRKGGGPGELLAPQALVSGARSTIFVADAGKRSIVGLVAVGAPASETRTVGVGNIWQLLSVKSGRTIVVADRRDSSLILKLNAASPVVLATMPKPVTKDVAAYEKCGIRMSSAPLLAPRLVAGANDSLVAYNNDGSLGITVVLENRTQRRFDAPDDRAKLNIAKIRDFLGDSMRITVGKRTCRVPTAAVALEAGIGVTVPGYSAILFDDTSRIWALRMKEINGPQVVDLYSVSSGYLGTISLGKANPVAVQGGRLVSLETDEDDSPSLVTYKFRLRAN